MRTRLALVVVVAGALTATSVAAAALAAPPSGHGYAAGATAAKKKKRRKRCRSKHKSPVANALSCRRLVRTLPNDPPTPTGSERYDFCRNSTYRYEKVNFDFDGRSFTTTYRGRWKAISSTSGSAGISGAIRYTVTNYRSAYSDGTPAETPPPSLLSEAIVFGPFGVDFAGATYLSAKAPC